MYIEIETEMPCPMRWAKSKWRFLCGGQHVKHETADTHKSIHFKGFTFANCSQNNSLKKRWENADLNARRKKTKHLWESNKTTVTEKKQRLKNSFINCRSCWKCDAKWRQNRKKKDKWETLYGSLINKKKKYNTSPRERYHSFVLVAWLKNT